MKPSTKKMLRPILTSAVLILLFTFSRQGLTFALPYDIKNLGTGLDLATHAKIEELRVGGMNDYEIEKRFAGHQAARASVFQRTQQEKEHEERDGEVDVSAREAESQPEASSAGKSIIDKLLEYLIPNDAATRASVAAALKEDDASLGKRAGDDTENMAGPSRDSVVDENEQTEQLNQPQQMMDAEEGKAPSGSELVDSEWILN